MVHQKVKNQACWQISVVDDRQALQLLRESQLTAVIENCSWRLLIKRLKAYTWFVKNIDFQ